MRKTHRYNGRNRSYKKKKSIIAIIIAILFLLGGAYPQIKEKCEAVFDTKDYGTIATYPVNEEPGDSTSAESGNSTETQEAQSAEGPYVTVNNNKPDFSSSELSKAKKSYKKFSDLDSLGRCGTAIASVGQDLLPTEDRGSIGMVKPTGWHTVRYDDLISDKYLYNRCHLIAFCLSGENANTKNLITGTRYMNVEGMLPFEEEILNYVKSTGNHVLYRVTPAFKGDNLVASGVYMTAESVEDNGKGLSFNVYCPNIQPGIEIDYATGDSHRAE